MVQCYEVDNVLLPMGKLPPGSSMYLGSLGSTKKWDSGAGGEAAVSCLAASNENTCHVPVSVELRCQGLTGNSAQNVSPEWCLEKCLSHSSPPRVSVGSWSERAARAKDTDWGASKSDISSLAALEAGSPRSRYQPGWFPLGPLSLAHRCQSPPCVLTWSFLSVCICVPLRRTLVKLDEEPPSDLIYIYKRLMC